MIKNVYNSTPSFCYECTLRPGDLVRPYYGDELYLSSWEGLHVGFVAWPTGNSGPPKVGRGTVALVLASASKDGKDVVLVCCPSGVGWLFRSHVVAIMELEL